MKMLCLIFLGFLFALAYSPKCASTVAFPAATMGADCHDMDMAKPDTKTNKGSGHKSDAQTVCHACAIPISGAARIAQRTIWDKSQPVDVRLPQLKSLIQGPPTPPPRMG